MAFRLITTICFTILVWNTISCLVTENVILENIHGDIYDCVDIYEQPSLQHPILDKERIKMTIAKELEKQKLLKVNQLQKNQNVYFKAEEYWLNKKGCPIGTVPIRRMTNKQQRRAKDASLSFANQSLASDITDFAGISIKASPTINRFTGASGIVTLYNPQLNGPGQYTSATISLQSGDATNLEEIQAGWIVHPKLYGDNRTRLYTHWTVDANQKTGCYNTLCPGFIQVSSEMPVDYAFPKVNAPEDDDQELQIQIYKDQEYYLQLYTMFSIGFWPDTIFKALRNGAETVQYGGKAYTPAGQTASPPMGNGEFWGLYEHRTCRMRQVMYGVDIDQEVQPDESLVQAQQTRCYCQATRNNNHDVYWNYYFLFGGAGNCTDPPSQCL